MKNFLIKVVILSLLVNVLPVSLVMAASELPYQSSIITEEVTAPWDYQIVSKLYQINYNNPEELKGKTYTVEIPYEVASNGYKAALYFDKNKKVWRPLPTTDNPQTKKVKIQVPFSSVRLAVFANSDILTVGTASWYKFKGGLFAASPDFAKGSVLRVYNLANGKFVDVTVNDYGPNRTLHPDRVVDLDKVAFNKIASTRDGVIKIRIEVRKAVGQNLSADLAPATQPVINSKSAIIFSEKDGKILWEKDSKKVSPLASLTKLVAAKVFLDTKPTLNKVVAYSKQDEDYNYLYCKPGESAKLKVKDGETMKIEDLLYSALVGSANNAVESLVRVSGLTREDFIAKMNENVKSWGATSTFFEEPTGLSPKNVSSPYDYAIIIKEVYNNPLIKKISTVTSYSFSTISTKIKHTLTNTNKLLQYNKLNIIGSKTGYLDEAGYCLMTRVGTKNGNLIVVNFSSNSKVNSFSDNEKLIHYGERLLNN
jgi:D-alanyl-D-alanine carboxypeptidase